jgi:hypothetical protein
MKGRISRIVAVLGLTGGLGAFAGCEVYRECVDPCPYQRYAAVARHSTEEVFANQVINGHILNQTVWNYHFEAGTDKLTPGGLDYLGYLSRVRPGPDPKLWLQTAHDLPAYDPAAPEKYEHNRSELDTKRRVAVLKFLAAETCGRPVPFDIGVHDVAPPGLAAPPVATTIQKHYANFQGTMPAGSAATTVGGSGTGSTSSSIR